MVLVNSTKPIRSFQRLLCQAGTLTLLAIGIAQPGQGQELKPSEELAADRLSAAEEETAYAAKSPAERVAVFLKIADRKIEAARKPHKLGKTEEVSRCLRGYSSALQGAVTAISWGEDLGTNMQRQAIAIRKAIRRHADILNKLENAWPSGSNTSILQVRAALASAEIAHALR